MDDIKRQMLFHLVMIWRRRWLALGIAWPICLAGWAVVAVLPNKYVATARVYVDTETLLGPLLKGIAVEVDMNQQVEVMQRTLLSRPNLEKVLRLTDLDLLAKSAEQKNKLVGNLAAVTAIRPQGHNLFTVEYASADPALARSVVQALLNIFVESNLGSSRRDMDQAKRFLDDHIDDYEKQLAQAEQRLADFKRKNPDFTQESASIASRLEAARQRLSEIKAQLEDASTRRASLQAELERVPQFLEVDAAPQVVIDNGGARRLPSELESRIAQVQRSLDDLSLRYTDQHPDVVATKRMLADLRQQLKDAGGGGAAESAAGRGGAAPRGASKQKISNTVHEQVQLKLVEVESDIQTLERRQAEQQAEVERLAELSKRAPAVEAELASLNRDYGVLRKNYEELLGRRESAKLSGSADTNAEKVEFRIIDPPETPIVPNSPNRPILLSGVLVAGIGAGIAIAFLLARMEDCFGTIRSLREAFTLPVLGSVSVTATVARGVRPLMKRAAFAVTSLGLFLVYGSVLLLYLYRVPILRLLGPVIQPLQQFT